MASAIPGVLAMAWQDYLLKVIPPGASEIQIKETQRAFYAGAGFLMDSLMKMLGPGNETTEADMQIIEGVAVEVRDFVKQNS